MTVLYTAIFGNYDNLLEQSPAPAWIARGIRLFCFTDNHNLTSSTYEILYVKRRFTDATIENRFYKLNPHRVLPIGFDYAIYFDGNVLVTEPDPDLFLQQHMVHADIMVPRHVERNCLYQEADFCIQMKRDDQMIIQKQMSQYKLEGFPVNYGLSENRVLFTKNSTGAREFYDFWWRQVFWGSRRDQLSFSFTAWKLPHVQIKYLDWNLELQGFAGKVKHLKRKKSKVAKIFRRVNSRLRRWFLS